jgi:hypothetical protein
LGTLRDVTIDNFAIDFVRLTVNVWLQVLIVIEMKRLFTRLKRWAEGEIRNRTGQTLVARIAPRQVSVDGE